MMTSNGGDQQRGGGLLGSLSNNPAVRSLGDAARDYAKARGTDAARKVGDRLSGMTDSMNDSAENGGFKATAVGEAAKRVTSGDNPVKAALGGAGEAVKEKVGGLFGRNKGGGGGNKKSMTILEDITVGVPVDVAYDQWTQFQEFGSFMKGVESVEQADETTTNWRAKVFKSRRSWKATVTEQVPDRRIAWTSEGAKGSTKGVVTFHPLADDLTQVLLVIEYYPQGLFEKTGNIWRAQGRRARLDLKNYRRFIMMRGEATGSWRGEIRDGEVVRGPDEEEEGPDDRAESRQDDDEQDEQDEQDEPNIAEDRSGMDDEDQDEDEHRHEDRDLDEDRSEDEDLDEEADEDEDEADVDEQDEEPAPRSSRRRRQPARAR
jgi:uncharacterized membrane protein